MQEYWLLLAGLVFLYVKYYHVLGSSFLILLVNFYALRLLLRQLSCMGLIRRDMNAKENPHDKAVDADFEIIEDDKN